jgi:hypothetical protein
VLLVWKVHILNLASDIDLLDLRPLHGGMNALACWTTVYQSKYSTSGTSECDPALPFFSDIPFPTLYMKQHAIVSQLAI